MKNIRCSNDSLGLAVTMGLGAGTALGVALEDIAVGVGFGAAAGILFGLAAIERGSDTAETTE